MARRTYGRLTSGFAELDKDLAEMKTGVANTAVRKGQVEGCKILKQAMRNGAPDKVSKRSIGYRVGMVGRVHQAKVGIGIGFGKYRPEKDEKSAKKNARIADARRAGWLAHLFVLGTKVRSRNVKALGKWLGKKLAKVGVKGGSTGALKPQPSFVAAAASSHANEAIAAQNMTISVEIEKFWRKSGRVTL